MKRKSFLLMLLGMLVGLLAVPLISCGQMSLTTAQLSEIAMAKSVDKSTGKPIEKALTFSPDTPEIFVSEKVSNAPSDTDVASEWIYVSGEATDLKNYTIDKVSVKVSGTKYVYFGMPLSSNTAWPKGDYKVVLSVGGKERGNVPFKVQ